MFEIDIWDVDEVIGGIFNIKFKLFNFFLIVNFLLVIIVFLFFM